MKLSEWLRGPVTRNDPVIRWLNFLALLALLALVAVNVLP